MVAFTAESDLVTGWCLFGVTLLRRRSVGLLYLHACQATLVPIYLEVSHTVFVRLTSGRFGGSVLNLAVSLVESKKVILAFCWVYVRKYQSRRESEVISTITAIFALAIALITSALLPVDIFLVSYVKNQNGTFKSIRANLVSVIPF
ncbi:UNVERIFIED_CONTAM: hypothetical protein K2H54_009629 [Gekko kuhli]